MVCTDVSENERGLTESGGRGQWRCAAKYEKGACLRKWHDDGTGRVFMLTDLDEVQCGKKYECLFFGEVTAEQDHIIRMLRAATLLVQSKWNTEKKALLNAIHELNDQCEKKLISSAEVRNIRACTSADVKEKCSYKPYCEDPRLSLNNAGEIFKALYLPPDTTSTIGKDRLDDLLLIMAMYCNWADVKPKNSGQAKTAWRKIDAAIQARMT